MVRRFYDLKLDVYVKGRWHLGEPVAADGTPVDDPWKFVEGRPVTLNQKLRVPVSRPGVPVAFEFAGAAQTPIVNARIASALTQMAPADIQLFPVDVDDVAGTYHLLNVARTIRCIDDELSREVRYFEASDPLHSHRAGEYRHVSGLRIDKSKAPSDARVFRLWGYFLPIIVDGEVKDALEAVGASGVRFDEV
ncbi:hypothetical protein JGU66_03305 [Myxococcaceae bacterium JPH2]|nr:hypothetical protein [Myxococcaceae bacterium JPH2]